MTETNTSAANQAEAPADQPAKAFETPPSTPSYTAHGIHVVGGRWTVSIIPAQSRLEGQQFVDHAQAFVVLPWTIAKALHAVLGETIAMYEATEGEVALPKSFVAARPK